jgi:hypothetical protein
VAVADGLVLGLVAGDDDVVLGKSLLRPEMESV